MSRIGQTPCVDVAQQCLFFCVFLFSLCFGFYLPFLFFLLLCFTGVFVYLEKGLHHSLTLGRLLHGYLSLCPRAETCRDCENLDANSDSVCLGHLKNGEIGQLQKAVFHERLSYQQHERVCRR